MNKTNKSKNDDQNGNNIKPNHHSSGRNKKGQQSPSEMEGIGNKKRTNKDENNKNDKKRIWITPKGQKRLKNLGIIANLVMVIFFIVSVFYQGNQTRKSLNLSRDAFNMAKVSNYNDSIMTVRDTLARERIVKMELRAYLSIADFEITSFSPGKQFKYMVRLKNTGKTPAQNINVFGGSKRYRPDVFINDFDSIRKHNPVISSATTGGEIDFIVNVFPDIDFTEKDIAEITIGRYPLYILGTIYYEDIFGDKHYTRYCRRVFRDSNGEFRFEYYKKYNEEK